MASPSTVITRGYRSSVNLLPTRGYGVAVVVSSNRYSVAASGFVVPGATAAGTFEPVVAGNRSAQ